MTFAAFLALFPMLLGMVGLSAPRGGQEVSSLIVEEQLIIRVPVRPLPPRIEWIEHKGPKCIDGGAIRGAFLSANDRVDFVLAGRRLLRAQLDEDCPALDFYEDFYINSDSGDGRICAKRDVIRSRMGGMCKIEQFRELQPKVKR